MTFKEARLDEHVVNWTLMPRFTPFPVEKQGTFHIELNGKVVGDVDVAKYPHGTYVSVTLVDTFLTIGQLTELMTDLKQQFNLSNDQRISIQQL